MMHLSLTLKSSRVTEIAQSKMRNLTKSKLCLLIVLVIYLTGSSTSASAQFIEGINTKKQYDGEIPIAGGEYDRCEGGVIYDPGYFAGFAVTPFLVTVDLAMRFSVNSGLITRVCVAFASYDPQPPSNIQYDIMIWGVNGSGGSEPGELIAQIPAAAITNPPKSFAWFATETNVLVPAGDIYAGIKRYPQEEIVLLLDLNTPNDSQINFGSGWDSIGQNDSTLYVRLIVEPYFYRSGFESK